jgi:methylamine utilization protein MauE
MVETISPVGYGDRTGRWLAAVALHTLGATSTAAAFGALLGATGSMLHAPFGPAGLTLAGAVALAYAAREAFVLPLPVPAARRQVPDWWRSFFSWPVAAVLYGAGLGIGFLTFLTNGGLVVVAVAAVLSGRPVVGAVLTGAFGLARGLSALVARPVRTREAGTALVDRLASSDPALWRRGNAAALALAGGSALLAVPGAVAAVGAGPARAGLFAAAAAIVAAAFTWSAAAKLLAQERWRGTLAGHELPRALSRAAAAVPAAELVVPAALVVGAPAAAGVLALVLLATFSFAIVRTRIRSGDDAVACGCFGGVRARDYRLLLARNAALAAAAASGLAAPSSPAARWFGVPAVGEMLPFALAVSTAVVAVLTVWRTATWLARGRRA